MAKEPTGTPPEEPTTPPETVFTQTQVNTIVAKDRRALQKELDVLKKTSMEQTEQLSSLQEELQAATEAATPQPAPEDLAGRLELQGKKHAREMETLQAQVTESQTALKDETQKRREVERDRALAEALGGHGCIDHLAGKRYFLPQIEFDPDEDRWIYRTQAGNLVSIADGIAEEMPDYLKPPTMQDGGSGSRGGSPKRRAKEATLETEQAKLASLRELATASGRTQDIVVFNQQKAKVAELQAEVDSHPSA